MVQQTRVGINLDGLDEMIRGFGGNFYTRVGVIGGDAGKPHPQAKTVHQKSGKTKRVADKAAPATMTNAEIGVIHEFGSVSGKIPARSWARFPLEFKAKEFLRFLGSSTIKGYVEKGQIKKVFQAMGVEAEGIIQDAFSSGGFGHWQKNAQSTIDAKGSSAPLIDIGEFRKSISSDVVEK